MNAFKMILAVSMLAGCAFAENDNNAIKVGTYNIRNQNGDIGTPNAWDLRKADVAATLCKQDLDVFGLQEVRPGQADFIKEKMPQYTMVGVHRDDGKRKGEASPVFFRKDRFDVIGSGTFWLSETPDVPGSRSWGAACTRICSWSLLKDRKSGKKFCFANAHTDHKSALACKNGMLLIIEKMREFAPKGTPIVFVGDHNCREESEPAKAVAAILKDALYASETTPTGSWRTFNGWNWADKERPVPEALKRPLGKRDTPRAKRIDYIYVSAGIKVKSYGVLNDARPGTKQYPSDHFPVNAVIEL